MTIFREQPTLLPGFRRGDRSVLETVYWFYVQAVERIVGSGFHVGDGAQRIEGVRGADLEDLVQEVFARAFAERARLAFDGLRDYAPYLATIARNALVDRARKLGRELPLAPEEGPSEPEPSPEDSPSWADPAVMSVVEAYLSSLPAALAAVHQQRYVEGRSQRDAAETLGLSRQRVRTLDEQLRKGLRVALRRAGLSPSGQ